MANRSVPQARKVLRNYTRSLNFNGTSDLATVPITPDTTGFNLSLFIKLGYTRPAADNLVVSWSTGFLTTGFQLMQELTTGKFYFKAEVGGSVKFVDAWGTGGSLLDKWSHIAVTYSPSSTKVYLNGNLIDSDTGTISTAVGQTLTLGRRSSVADRFFKGLMNELCFQNTTTPWTQAQIDDLYFRGIYPSGSTFYSLDGNVLDQNGLNGLTLTGTSYVGDRPC